MSNKLNLLGNTGLAVIIMNAMSMNAEAKDFFETYHMLRDGTGSVVDIEIRVNGVVVPFMKAMEEAIAHMTKNLDEEIKKEAIKMIVNRPVLQNLINDLENAEWTISKALEKLDQ